MITNAADLINHNFEEIEIPEFLLDIYNEISDIINSSILEDYFFTYSVSENRYITEIADDVPIFLLTPEFFELSFPFKVMIMSKIKSILIKKGWRIIYDSLDNDYGDNKLLIINIDISKLRDDKIDDILNEDYHDVYEGRYMRAGKCKLLSKEYSDHLFEIGRGDLVTKHIKLYEK